ncbi:MAG: hypothetical protein PHW03_02625 [Eubacteriales bacterium]|nr:hypothetical protein [Eubacteriales bacterium]
MKKITKADLITLVNSATGASFISLDMKSEAKMRKTGNPYVGAVKEVTLSGQINFDYANAVNNQLEREGNATAGTFTAQARAWGTREGNWITHNGNHYLTIKVQNSSDPVFFFEGKRVDKTVLEPFLIESKKPHTQAELDKPVTVRDVNINNIRSIRLFNEEYQVV